MKKCSFLTTGHKFLSSKADDDGNTRSIFNTNQVPGYQVKSNRDLVEATFVFPNKKDNYDKSFDDNFHDLVIEGRNLSSPLLAPDSFFSSLPKRSVDPDTFSNRTGRSVNGFIRKYEIANTSRLQETFEN